MAKLSALCVLLLNTPFREICTTRSTVLPPSSDGLFCLNFFVLQIWKPDKYESTMV